MQYVADLHLHSKYSRAVSKDMILPTMAEWGKKKGIDILSAADWTHSLWFREINAQLEEAAEGLYKLKTQNSKLKTASDAVKTTIQNSKVKNEILFLLSTEISSIYKQGEKLRRIHNLVFAPNFETAEKINKELVRRGCNLHSDGRPIIGISSRDLLELIMSIDKRCLLIPCHAWTPHFGIYGSASGFDSLEEAFEDLSKYVYGIETGLSSDPEMNWQMEELNNRSILSFSDAHSPAKMGREATVFVDKNGISNGKFQISNKQITYEDIASAIKRIPGSNLKIGYTIEFYPEEGKYHFSGHRNCRVVFGPQEIKTKGNTCPMCKRPLTEGVLYRVQQLGKQSKEELLHQKISSNGIKWHLDKTKTHPPFVKVVPLLEIIAESLGKETTSPKVKEMFDSLCIGFNSEINALLKTPISEIQKIAGERIAYAIDKVRKGEIFVEPGYDGEYGKVKIWNHDQDKTESKKDDAKMQLGLF